MADITVEQVEKLLEYADVSYEEARDALEQAGGDMLDAIVFLERQGRINSAGKRVKQDGAVVVLPATEQRKSEQTPPPPDAKDFFQKVGEVCGKIINIMFVVTGRGGNRIFSMPAIFVVLLMFFVFWLTIPLLLLGLICGMRYNFEGPADVGIPFDKVNNVADEVNNAAEHFRSGIENNGGDDSKDDDGDNGGGGTYRI